MAHKRIDVAIEAFNRLRLPLVVVGDGPEGRRLRRLAGPSVKLAGRLSDPEVAQLMRSAKALVVTAAEEFGIAAVESLASGRPVIALGSGGVLESVHEGETGAYYRESDPEALAEVVAGFDPTGDRPGGLRSGRSPFRHRPVPGRAARYRGRGGGGRVVGRPRPPGGGHGIASAPCCTTRRGAPLKCALRHTGRRLQNPAVCASLAY